MRDDLNVEILHKKSYNGNRPVCAVCRASWPCPVARRMIREGRTVSNPWWYINPQQAKARDSEV